MAQLIQRRCLAYLKKTKLDNLLLFHLSTSKNITSPLYNIVLSLIFFSFKSAWIFACALQFSSKTFSCIFWLKCSCSALLHSLCMLQYVVLVFLRNKVQTSQNKYRGMFYYLIVHISYVCAKLSRNTGVISKLRHYLPLKHLTQIYYNLIYPYISYAIVAWGSTSKKNLHKIQTNQNHVIRLMFFATLSGKNTDSALHCTFT